MAWYAAHILMRICYRQGPAEPHYLEENVVLFDARDASEAKSLAEQHGRADSNESDVTFTCDGRPAFWAFAGIRVVVDCDNRDERPSSGTEVTYLNYRVAKSEDVERLLAGNDVFVEFGV